MIQIVITTFSQNPIADFEVNVDYKCGYATTEFINKSVNADTFLWDDNGTGRFIEIYEPRGTNIGIDKEWTVTLIAIGNGLRDTASKHVEVSQTRLNFDYTFIDSSQYAPAEVQFNNQSKVRPEDTLKYHWDLGDDSTSEHKNPFHAYTNPGTYYVTLNGIKNSNCELSMTDYLIVKDTAQRGEVGLKYRDCSMNPNEDSLVYAIRNDSIIFTGYYYGNCGTRKTATIRERNDTVYFKIWEVGPLTTCYSGGCFYVAFPFADKDSAIVYYGNKRLASSIQSTSDFNTDIKVYPNPVGDFLELDMSELPSENYSYSITDLNGRKRQTGKLMQKRLKINRSKITKGLYILTINKDTKIIFKEKILIK